MAVNREFLLQALDAGGGGQLVLELNDPAPFPASGHDRFGFSSWQNDTWFDNLRIEPL